MGMANKANQDDDDVGAGLLYRSHRLSPEGVGRTGSDPLDR